MAKEKEKWPISTIYRAQSIFFRTASGTYLCYNIDVSEIKKYVTDLFLNPLLQSCSPSRCKMSII